MKKNFRSMRRYTIVVLVTAAACLASGCAKKEVSVEVVSGAENENKPQISIQENPAALFLKITAEYDSDGQDEHSLISTKTAQIRILDEVDAIRVEIEDNGKGIAAKDLGHIFERFYRTDSSRNSTKGGSGIGLSIVKKIIEDHGGYIWATSREGEETCMHFVIRKYKEVEHDE